MTYVHTMFVFCLYLWIQYIRSVFMFNVIFRKFTVNFKHSFYFLLFLVVVFGRGRFHLHFAFHCCTFSFISLNQSVFVFRFVPWSISFLMGTDCLLSVCGVIAFVCTLCSFTFAPNFFQSVYIFAGFVVAWLWVVYIIK